MDWKEARKREERDGKEIACVVQRNPPRQKAENKTSPRAGRNTTQACGLWTGGRTLARPGRSPPSTLPKAQRVRPNVAQKVTWVGQREVKGERRALIAQRRRKTFEAKGTDTTATGRGRKKE